MRILLLAVIIVGALLAAYVYMIRPVLRRRGPFTDFYNRADGFWAALNNWTRGYRTRVWAWFQVISGGLLAALSFLDLVPWHLLLSPKIFWALPLIFVATGIITRILRKATTGPEPGIDMDDPPEHVGKTIP